MSLLQQALSFKTDAARLEWFETLSDSEKQELLSEFTTSLNEAVKAFQPMLEAFQQAVNEAVSSMTAWYESYVHPVLQEYESETT